LQVICGPGHDHNNFESQRAGTKFKLFELIGEQIWRPTPLILDEVVQCPKSTTSLDWPDFLRFRVLDKTTPWEQWSNLYIKEHYGHKPLMPDCYLTHGWNKLTKSPIWLSREVRNLGSLRSILLQWFSLPKDKVTIVFEYIDKDSVRADTQVWERLSHLSLEFSDQEVIGTISSDSPSPIPTLQSSSSYQLPSSPPHQTTMTLSPQESGLNAAGSYRVIPPLTPLHELEPPNYPLSDSLPKAISEFEFPTVQQLIATSSGLAQDPSGILTSITLRPMAPDSSSSALSTIPDSPQLLLSSLVVVNTSQNPLHSTSKLSKIDFLFIIIICVLEDRF